MKPGMICIKRIFNFLTRKPQIQNIELEVQPDLVNSFSQYGEDLVLEGILGTKPEGFYIDIGANHPKNFSNTKRFYDRGWRGINIEPNPILFEGFLKTRLKDININAGIGLVNQKVPFYCISADTLSCFDKNDADRNCLIFKERITDVKYIQMITLQEIFTDYVKNQSVDFISIDVEGFEMNVLKGYDWKSNRPALILIEISHNTARILSFLQEIGYELVYKNTTNGIFLDVRKYCAQS